MLINNTLISWNKNITLHQFQYKMLLCEWNDDVINNTLFIAFIAACEKVNTLWAGHSVDAACAQRGEIACILKAKVGICRRLVQQKGHIVGLFSVWQRLLEMQAKSFRSVPRSIDAASVQIPLNATLMLIVVCDVTLSSHLFTLNFIFTV